MLFRFIRALYIASILLCLSSFGLLAGRATYLWKKKHPDIKLPKVSLREHIETMMQILVISFCPIVNLELINAVMFCLDDICNGAIERMEKEYGIN